MRIGLTGQCEREKESTHPAGFKNIWARIAPFFATMEILSGCLLSVRIVLLESISSSLNRFYFFLYGIFERNSRIKLPMRGKARLANLEPLCQRGFTQWATPLRGNGESDTNKTEEAHQKNQAVNF